MESKKKNILTILLIIIIVVIIGVIGYLGFELINENIKEKNAKVIVDEFDSQIPTISEEEFAEEMAEEMTEVNQGEENGSENGENGNSPGENGSSSGGSYYRNSSYYTQGINLSGYWVVGTIRIPASGIKYPIFTEPSKGALERGTGLVYTSNGVNQPGNTVIAGHNYKNNLFFSKNKYLVEGNVIYIKDVTGVEIAYSVTKMFVTTSTDTSCYQRDTGGKREITLTTCTDNGSKTGERLIVQAREY